MASSQSYSTWHANHKEATEVCIDFLEYGDCQHDHEADPDDQQYGRRARELCRMKPVPILVDCLDFRQRLAGLPEIHFAAVAEHTSHHQPAVPGGQASSFYGA